MRELADRTDLGRSECLCNTGCVRVFASERAYESHIIRGPLESGIPARGNTGIATGCADPASLGMEPNERGAWRVPMPDEVLARWAA